MIIVVRVDDIIVIKISNKINIHVNIFIKTYKKITL